MLGQEQSAAHVVFLRALNWPSGPTDWRDMAEVLIVDDDPDIRGMLAFTLDDYGFTVREAENGAAAIAALEERAPEVMVLDLMMPVLDGFGVLAVMQERGLASRTRVLILSAKVDERAIDRTHELGASDYVSKPFDPDSLAARLNDLIDAIRTQN